MSWLLAAGVGCVIASSEVQVEAVPPRGEGTGGWRETVDAWVVADGACEHVDLVAPPGATVGSPWIKLKLGDDTSYKPRSGRVQPLPRDVLGFGGLRVHVPELLRGDRVRLRFTRDLTDAHYVWHAPSGRPGRDTLVLPRGEEPTATHGTTRRGRRLTSDAADAIVHLGPEPTLRGVGSPSARDLSPPEALAVISRWSLLPRRSDLDLVPSPDRVGAADATTIAWTLTSWTSDGPNPLQVSPVWAPGGSDPSPRPVTQVAVDVPRNQVWAHPDLVWEAGWGIGPTPPAAGDRAPAPVGAPAGDGPRLDAAAHVRRTISLELPEGKDPRDALVPGAGSVVRHTDAWTLPGSGSRARLVDAPPGGRIVEARVEGGTHSVVRVDRTADQVLLIAAPGEAPTFHVVTTRPDVLTCAESRPPAGVALTVEAVRGEGATIGREGDFWWVRSWGGHLLHDERARVIAGLNGRFNRRTVPEPGLPMRVRGHASGWDLAAQFPDLLRDRAVVGDLPVKPTWPRPLYRARKEGAVTSAEAALIVRAYALQAKFETDWALVRPAWNGDSPPACPAGHDEGLVRLGLDGETRWLDPGCTVCGPFEVRPELLGAAAIGPWVDRTPPPPSGSWTVRVDADRVTWELEGPAALELRRWLTRWPKAERPARLAERLAGAGASFVRAEGATEQGAPITVVAVAADPHEIPAPDEVLLPATGADGRAFVAWPGPRTWVVDGQTRTVELGVEPRFMEAAAHEAARLALRGEEGPAETAPGESEDEHPDRLGR